MNPPEKLNLGVAQDFHKASNKGCLDLYNISNYE